MLDEADLEKDKKPSLLLLGLINVVTLAMLVPRSFQAAAQSGLDIKKKIKAIPIFFMADSAARENERKAQRPGLLQGRQGTSTGVWSLLQVGNTLSSQAADTWTGDPSVKPIHTFYLQTGLSHTK